MLSALYRQVLRRSLFALLDGKSTEQTTKLFISAFVPKAGPSSLRERVGRVTGLWAGDVKSRPVFQSEAAVYNLLVIYAG